MRNRPTGFWQALEAVPGAAAVGAEWKSRCGNDYGTAKAFLRPNGKLAMSSPCSVPRGCGCEHDVVCHGADDIVAVCRCERGCETFPLQRSDIVIYELDRQALDTALARVFGLIEETDAGTDLPGTTRIGVYSPYAGYRFPVYLAIQIEPDDFNEALDGLLGRNGTPFILLSPTRELCSAKAEKRLTDKRSGFVSLSENVAIGDKRQVRPLRPIDEILAQFRGTNLPSPKADGATAFFPTPPDASWGDVSIRFKDGHTVPPIQSTTYDRSVGLRGLKCSPWLENFVDLVGDLPLQRGYDVAVRIHRQANPKMAKRLHDQMRMPPDPSRSQLRRMGQSGEVRRGSDGRRTAPEPGGLRAPAQRELENAA